MHITKRDIAQTERTLLKDSFDTSSVIAVCIKKRQEQRVLHVIHVLNLSHHVVSAVLHTQLVDLLEPTLHTTFLKQKHVFEPSRGRGERGTSFGPFFFSLVVPLFNFICFFFVLF